MSDEKIILFPTDRIVNKETAKQNPEAGEKVRLERTKEFVEGNVNELAMVLLKQFVEMAMNTNKPAFTRDLALLVEIMRGTIYRDFEVEHPAQKLADKMVSVNMTRFGPQAEINYEGVLPDLKHKNNKTFTKEIKDEIKYHNDGWTEFSPDFEFDDEPDDRL